EKNQPRSPATIRSCSRSTGPLSSVFAFAAIALMLCLDRVRHAKTYRIAHAHSARYDDVAVDAERERLDDAVPPVAREELERVEIGDRGVGIARRDDATADVPERDDHRVADRHPASQPLVLLVRLDAVDLEQHPEAAPVDRLGRAGLRPQPLERA